MPTDKTVKPIWFFLYILNYSSENILILKSNGEKPWKDMYIVRRTNMYYVCHNVPIKIKIRIVVVLIYFKTFWCSILKGVLSEKANFLNFNSSCLFL